VSALEMKEMTLRPHSVRNRTPARRWRVFVALLVALAAAPAARRAGAADSFVVVVNAGNPAVSLEAQTISDLFLKKSEAWPDGTKAAPVDLDENSSSRTSFSNRIHHKSTAAVKSYWQKMIFSGRDVPPPEKSSPDEVLAFVRSRRGGIGYVPASTVLGAGVKVLVVKP
jgi:ABC-type phosphate transport system substrate-binding protein